MNRINKILLFLIILIGFSLRIVDIDWDEGYIFHPDERAIIMNATSLEYPKNLEEFLSPESSLNTNFFAYGNLPIYFLKISGDVASMLNPIYSQYSGIYLIGRLINVFFSTLTIILVFIYTKKLFNIKTGLLASFFFSIAVFPIQNSHFFTVDTLLSFFILLTLIFLNSYYKKPTFANTMLIGISLGLCLATKISSLPILLTILFFVLISELIKKRAWKKIIIPFTQSFLTIILFSSLVFIVSQPYAVIDYKEFLDQTIYQSKMGTDPFVFPYTLQYVGKLNFIYEINNITLWGLGLPLGIISILGYIFLIVRTGKNVIKNVMYFPLLFFSISFFVINAIYAVGWMRYLLPVYPLLTIFAAYFVVQISTYILNSKLTHKTFYEKAYLLTVLVLASVWSISFMHIYFNPHPKITATEWIIGNIPDGSTIATEHWDDVLPVYGGERYNFISLPLYEPDTTYKWEKIHSDLKVTDYIIIASNRLYTPLQKLTNCKVLPENRCYPRTAEYYKKLFSEKLGFEKVAEFSSYPTIPILNIKINDQSADESFTVYDHPKIMIFKRTY